MVSTYINLMMSEMELIVRHFKHIVGIGVCYGLTNFIATKVMGKPIYFFLDWESFESLLILKGIIVVNSLLYLGVALLFKLFRVRRSKKNIKSS